MSSLSIVYSEKLTTLFSYVLFINIEFQNKVDRFATNLNIDLNFVVPFCITESVGRGCVPASSFSAAP